MPDESLPALEAAQEACGTPEKRPGQNPTYRLRTVFLKSAQLRQYIESFLDDREREIIALRYGLGGRRPLTQREVAKRLGISRSYVSRIEKKAVEVLRCQGVSWGSVQFMSV